MDRLADEGCAAACCAVFRMDIGDIMRFPDGERRGGGQGGMLRLRNRKKRFWLWKGSALLDLAVEVIGRNDGMRRLRPYSAKQLIRRRRHRALPF